MSASRSALAALLIAAAVATAAHAENPPLYHISRSINLGTPDRWDYLTYEPATQRVYLAHGSFIDVVDIGSGKLAGQVPVSGANGIVVVPAVGKGYAGSSSDKTVVVFDLKTLQTLKAVPAAADTDAVVYDAFSQRVFVMQGDPHALTMIDTAKDTFAGTVALAGQPEFGAVDGQGKLFVNIADKRAIQRVDTRTGKVDATWPIPDCESPHGLSIDTASSRLFASCANAKLLVINARNGAVVATLPIGMGTDATAYDPHRKRVFSSNRDGTLSVIHEDDPAHFVLLGNTPTQVLARTMALDPESGRIFLVAADRIDADLSSPDPRKRYTVRPGSARLLIAEPTP